MRLLITGSTREEVSLPPKFSTAPCDCTENESTLRRKPCTLGESGFLRTPSWVVRCFIASFQNSPGLSYDLTPALHLVIMFANKVERCNYIRKGSSSLHEKEALDA